MGTTIYLLPIPSGRRLPSVPIAKYMTLARIASPVSIDKKYEERFTIGLRKYFEQPGRCGNGESSTEKAQMRLVKQGDVIAIPIPREQDSSIEATESGQSCVESIVYFSISYISYDPLLPLEEDFVMSASSQARAGEFGCWVDVEKTRMMSVSVQHGRAVKGMTSWYGIGQ